MAELTVPQHRPHEQLRTEAPAQKKHSDKYVSAFVSSENQVDMTFTNPVLQDSADHYKVGVDELTVNLSNLSMLEYEGNNDVLFVIRRLGIDNEPRPVDAALMPTQVLIDSCTFKIDKPYLTIHGIVDRFRTIANALGSYIEENGLEQPGDGAADIWRLPLDEGRVVTVRDEADLLALRLVGRLQSQGARATANFRCRSRRGSTICWNWATSRFHMTPATPRQRPQAARWPIT